MTLTRRLHRRLPPWAHRLLKPALAVAGLPRTQEFALLEGAERSGGKPLRLAFAGPADLKETVLKRAFAGGAAQRALGPVPAWLPSSALAARAPEADLIVRRVPAHYEGMPGRGVLATLPAWVPMRLDLKDPECAKRGKEKLARMRAKAKRSGFTMAAARRKTDFPWFYDRLHAPYVKGRHGEAASLQSREETMAKLRSGAWSLLAVRRGAETVAAGTVEHDGVRARFWQLGVLDGDRALLEAGAADAVYAGVIDDARERGCESLHLGHSRPFARDGVLEYKRMLGAYVSEGRDERRGAIELSVSRRGGGVDDFLADNPLIALEPDGRCGLRAFARGDADGERVRWWRDRYCFKNTLGLRIQSLDGDL